MDSTKEKNKRIGYKNYIQKKKSYQRKTQKENIEKKEWDANCSRQKARYD